MDLIPTSRSAWTTSGSASPKAAQDAGRSAGDVRLLAVSKTFSLEHVRAAAAAGQHDFGENRVQEALQKMDGSADLKIRWHLIGTLQSNKVAEGRAPIQRHPLGGQPEAARRRSMPRRPRRAPRPELLVQVDLAGEATKHGAPPDEAMEIVRAAAGCRAARLRRADDDSAVLRRPGRYAAIFRQAARPSRYTAAARVSTGRCCGNCRWA